MSSASPHEGTCPCAPERFLLQKEGPTAKESDENVGLWCLRVGRMVVMMNELDAGVDVGRR